MNHLTKDCHAVFSSLPGSSLVKSCTKISVMWPTVLVDGAFFLFRQKYAGFLYRQSLTSINLTNQHRNTSGRPLSHVETQLAKHIVLALFEQYEPYNKNICSALVNCFIQVLKFISFIRKNK